jgi:hypothetical protein
MNFIDPPSSSSPPFLFPPSFSIQPTTPPQFDDGWMGHTHTYYITLCVGLPAMRHKGIYTDRQTHSGKNVSSIFGTCGMPFSMCVAFNLIVPPKKINKKKRPSRNW